jgi:cytosine/uracil/thiamine/allantoin permease
MGLAKRDQQRHLKHAITSYQHSRYVPICQNKAVNQSPWLGFIPFEAHDNYYWRSYNSGREAALRHRVLEPMGSIQCDPYTLLEPQCTRALVFLGSLTQVYATMVTNISSNSIPVGCDLTGLFPRYFTIRRGQILCSILAILIVPWKLVYSGASFLAFLGSYVVFITPIAAMMIVDYWVIRKGNVHVPSLYKASSISPYYYYHGFNLRAYGAWAIAVGMTISGIAGILSPGSISQTAVNIYNTGELLS